VQCEERAAASWGGRSSLSGPGRSCDVAALGGQEACSRDSFRKLV